jgi:hypothetical protein
MEISDPIQDTIIQGPIHWDLLTVSSDFPSNASLQGSHSKVSSRVPWRCEILLLRTRSHPRSQKISQGLLLLSSTNSLSNPKAHLSPIRGPLFCPLIWQWTLFCLLTSSSFHFLTFLSHLDRERDREIPLLIVCLLYVGLFFPSTCDNLENLLVKVGLFWYIYLIILIFFYKIKILKNSRNKLLSSLIKGTKNIKIIVKIIWREKENQALKSYR